MKREWARDDAITTWWLLWYVVVLHGVWGMILLGWPVAANTTPIHAIAVLHGSWPRLAGASLLIVSLAALLGMHVVAAPRWRLACLLPQQFILMIGALGALRAILLSQYADGVPRPTAFILADQLTDVIAAIFHTFVLIDVTARRPRE